MFAVFEEKGGKTKDLLQVGKVAPLDKEQDILFPLHLLQSPDGDTFSVIENPVAVSHQFRTENTTGGEGREVHGCHTWLKGIHSTKHGRLL